MISSIGITYTVLYSKQHVCCEKQDQLFLVLMLWTQKQVLCCVLYDGWVHVICIEVSQLMTSIAVWNVYPGFAYIVLMRSGLFGQRSLNSLAFLQAKRKIIKAFYPWLTS